MNLPRRPERSRRQSEPASRARRLANAFRPHLLEPLEDRAVPAVLFTPLVPQTAVDSGGVTLPDPEVHLIFWGAGWNTSGSLSSADVVNSARGVLEGTFQGVQSGPYLKALSQYRSGLGSAHLG